MALRRRRVRRRLRRGVRRRITKSIVSTSIFPVTVRGNPRPTLAPDTAWHKRVVALTVTNAANTTASINKKLIQNALTATATFFPWFKIRWVKVYAVSPAFSPVEVTFKAALLTQDSNAPDLVIQDYGTGTSLAGVGMKVPYAAQQIDRFESTTSSPALFVISATANAQTYVCHIGISFRL